eukprot:scaffold2154_cov90-Isochrysis_galbana.AAC.1
MVTSRSAPIASIRAPRMMGPASTTRKRMDADDVAVYLRVKLAYYYFRAFLRNGSRREGAAALVRAGPPRLADRGRSCATERSQVAARTCTRAAVPRQVAARQAARRHVRYRGRRLQPVRIQPVRCAGSLAPGAARTARHVVRLVHDGARRSRRCDQASRTAGADLPEGTRAAQPANRRQTRARALSHHTPQLTPHRFSTHRTAPTSQRNRPNAGADLPLPRRLREASEQRASSGCEPPS